MKINKIASGLVFGSVALTSSLFAQEGSMGGAPLDSKPHQSDSFIQKMWGERKEMRDEMRGAREDFKQDMKAAREQFRDEMKGKKEGVQNGSSTASSTPWKNLKDNMKEARGEFKDKMRDAHDDFKQGMKDMKDRYMHLPVLSATATNVIAAKLGISAEALKAQLASGTPLRDLVKDKIKPEEMKQILPPKIATVTKKIEEKGFFNKFRANLFGPREEAVKREINEFGEVVSTTTEPIKKNSIWSRFFNF